MTLPPNIFTFATSELSQDAVLCYWASWADPKADPLMNAIGQALVRRLANRPIEIRSIQVMRQVQNIDVAISINDDLFIVVEDKTETAEHSDQINRYRKIAEGFTDSQGKPWGTDRVTTAYVKTGNAPQSQQPGDSSATLLDRRDLLSLLGPEVLPDQILEQFRQHLISWESETTSFGLEPLTEDRWTWDSRGQQGFYMWLEKQLGNGTWHYVANPSGGFLGYYWNWRQQKGMKCQLYLQIEHCRKLQVRIADVRDDDDKYIKAPPHIRYQLLDHLKKFAPQIDSSIVVEKSGRYKPGWHAGVANLHFNGNDTFLALNNEDLLDKELTIQNLRLAMNLVDLATSTELETR